MTPAGKRNLVETLKKQIKSINNRLTRQISVLEPLLDSTDAVKVNHEAAMLDRIYADITETHSRLCQILGEEEDKEEHDAAIAVLDGIDDAYFSLKSKLCTWQLESEKVAREAFDNASVGSSKRSTKSSKSRSSGSAHSACSRVSKVSKASSQDSRCSSKSLELKAKIAGLKAESEAIKKTAEAKLTAQLLKKEQEIRKIEAME